MAKSLQGAQPIIGQTATQAPPLATVRTLRLTLGLGIVVSALISLVGTSWDIQWHLFVGRDRTLIPPHLMMLTGITLGGLLALTAVCVETMVVRRKPQLAQYNTQFAGMFYAPLGAYIAGFAALDAAVAFPLDAYWHSLYGIDVALWTPFHVMILMGMGIMPLGGTYMMSSAKALAHQIGDRRGEKIGQFGTLAALGITFSIFTILLADAISLSNYIDLAILKINLYPLCACLLTAFIFAAAKTAVGTRFAVSGVILMYIVVAAIFSIFVPPATGYLVGVEQLQYRRALQSFAYLSILAMRLWPLLPILLAPLYDWLLNHAGQHNWSHHRILWSSTGLCLLAAIPVMAFNLTAITRIIQTAGPVGLVLSFLLGILGSYVGTILGRRSGEVIQNGGQAR
ncbi:hypothetical protein KDW_27210 [Dictyobacter vulcani]|uniref:Uncharacterized protein n=1 Tax=Dictyobacter vulcani TaxID=2607529 RepID=A0A5J4KR04_9CHLR|nr:hypothetical protein [Dictyobacter vulcani]GER88559.1 hypothetical protein KDW_27210 [Dictyobacter vulcani]